MLEGSLTPARGAVIGKDIPSHADQQALYSLLKEREKGGKRLTNDQVEELIRLSNRTSTHYRVLGRRRAGQYFWPRSDNPLLLPEKAEISDYVRKQLATERKLFGIVSTEARSREAGGNRKRHQGR